MGCDQGGSLAEVVLFARVRICRAALQLDSDSESDELEAPDLDDLSEPDPDCRSDPSDPSPSSGKHRWQRKSVAPIELER